MIKKIYFDWYDGQGEDDQSFGQITFVNKYDEKLAVHNFDNVDEREFKSIYYFYGRCAEDVYTEYGRNVI